MNLKPNSTNINPIIAVAPMIDWTDRHCRYFFRLLSKNTRLYTEMVSTGALLFGDLDRHLRYSPAEHEVILQIGGNNPQDLAKCAVLIQKYGYDGINLNCGCPSDKVLKGAFGACLMLQPKLVADCVKAMQDVVDIPISVKQRIGIDKQQSYAFVRDFVGIVSQAGCQHFDVHARSAWLQGLSPKENRQVPPLDYTVVYRLKRDFPTLTIVLNGGVKNSREIKQHLAQVDGVMIGRQAYHDAWWLSRWDSEFFASSPPSVTRAEVVQQYLVYMLEQHRQCATPWSTMIKPMLSLYHGQPGARKWRRLWSEQGVKTYSPNQIIELTNQLLQQLG